MSRIVFPLETVLLSNGCIAIWRNKKGPHRQEAGPKIDGTYVRLIIDGKAWQAHRLSYHLNVKAIPRRPKNLKTGLILHTCDNQWCIAPDHLYKGTSSSNRNDMYARSPTVHERQHQQLLGNAFAKGHKWTQQEYEHRRKIEKQRVEKFIASRWTPKRRLEQARLMKGNHYGRI